MGASKKLYEQLFQQEISEWEAYYHYVLSEKRNAKEKPKKRDQNSGEKISPKSKSHNRNL